METQIKLSGNSVYWKDFKWGTLYPSESTFKLVPRTTKNIFRLFGDGLGINADALVLLAKLNITFIEGTLNGSPFRVSVDKWIKKGIPSPYSNNKVDLQIILKLDDIFPEGEEEKDTQLSIFNVNQQEA